MCMAFSDPLEKTLATGTMENSPQETKMFLCSVAGSWLRWGQSGWGHQAAPTWAGIRNLGTEKTQGHQTHGQPVYVGTSRLAQLSWVLFSFCISVLHIWCLILYQPELPVCPCGTSPARCWHACEILLTEVEDNSQHMQDTQKLWVPCRIRPEDNELILKRSSPPAWFVFAAREQFTPKIYMYICKYIC